MHSFVWLDDYGIVDPVLVTYHTEFYGGILDEESAAILLASEAATMKYIRNKSSIPVQEVFYYRSDFPKITIIVHRFPITELNEKLY